MKVIYFITAKMQGLNALRPFKIVSCFEKIYSTTCECVKYPAYSTASFIYHECKQNAYCCISI